MCIHAIRHRHSGHNQSLTSRMYTFRVRDDSYSQEEDIETRTQSNGMSLRDDIKS